MSRRHERERYWVHSQDALEVPMMMPTTQMCVLPVCSKAHTTDCRLETCPGCARAPGDDGLLCQGHKRRLFGRLRGIPELYERLAGEPAFGTPAPSARPGRAAGALLVSGDVLDLLRGDVQHLSVLESLEGWCRIVIEERKFHWPPPADSVFGRLTVACSFLRTHLEWVAKQDWVDELDHEVGLIHRALRTAVEPQGRFKPTRIDCQIETCTEGKLSWDFLDEPNPVLVCRVCGDTWQPEAFWLLAEHTRNPVTLRDAEQMGVATYTDLRNWLARGSLPNHGSEGAPRVLLVEVMAVRKDQLAKGRTA